MKFTERLNRLFIGGGMAKELKYPQSAIQAFEQGARLDLRLRLAVDFLKTPAAGEYVKSLVGEQATYVSVAARAEGGLAQDSLAVARETATFSLYLATELMALAEAQGLVAPMPDNADIDLDAATRAQAKRMAKFEWEKNLAMHREQQAHAAGVVPVPGGRVIGPSN